VGVAGTANQWSNVRLVNRKNEKPPLSHFSTFPREGLDFSSKELEQLRHGIRADPKSFFFGGGGMVGEMVDGLGNKSA